MDREKMPNRKYESGRRFEYRAKNELLKQNWTVFRMAGSKSAFDLIAVKEQEIIFVQCKAGKVSKKDRLKIQEAEPINKMFHQRKMICHKIKRKIYWEEIGIK
ncbi:MAG TPA: hypothetical protein ENH95_02815 [Nitrosopumilus sp.]|nr:hypothetical protein [Nitrosopumilus sp.]